MKHYIYLCIYICISSAFISLYAQSNLQDWKESYCADIDKINSDNMWSCDTGVNQYISFGNEDLVNVFKFTSNRDRATLKPYYRLKDFPSSIFDYDKLKLYVENEKMVYIPYESRLYKIDVDKEEWYQYVSQRRINFNDGQCFLMNDKHYFIDYNYNNLYQLKLEKEGILTPRLLDYLAYKAQKNLSIVILEDKFYYLSQDGFCEVSIDNKVNCELIPSVTGMDETSILVTDKQSKIWIINSANGVIEYDTTNKNVREIAEFPGNESKINVCFYSNGYLYYISQDKKFYSLNVSHNEEKRDNTRFGKKQLENVRKGLYRAIGHENNMTLEDLELPKDIDLGYGEHPYLVNGNLIYNANARTNKIDCFNIEDKTKITYALEDTPEKIDFFYGKCFYKDNNHYFLDCRNKKLYQLQLNEPIDEREGTITVTPCDNLEYTPKADTSIVVLADTLYYFSNSGFCAVKVNDTEVTSEIIDSVTVTDKVSVLVTDGEYRIWIINETDGVVEYNTKTKKAKTIDIFPFFSNYYVENNVSFQGIFIFTNNTKQELSTTAFYSNRYLHYMINGAVYFLPVPPDDKNQRLKINDIPEDKYIPSTSPEKTKRNKIVRRIQPKLRRPRLDSHLVKTPGSFLDLKPAN